MRQILDALSLEFRTLLIKNRVPQKDQCFYLKWLRYYLDFCHKYQFTPSNRKSLPQFLRKLQDKKQSDAGLRVDGDLRNAVAIAPAKKSKRGEVFANDAAICPRYRRKLLTLQQTGRHREIEVSVLPRLVTTAVRAAETTPRAPV